MQIKSVRDLVEFERLDNRLSSERIDKYNKKLTEIENKGSREYEEILFRPIYFSHSGLSTTPPPPKAQN